MRIYDITGGPLLSDEQSDPDNTRPLTHYKRKWGGEEHVHYNVLKVRRKTVYALYKIFFNLIRRYHDFISKSRPSRIEIYDHEDEK